MLEKQDRTDEQQKLDRIVLIATSALFCYDRAVSTNLHSRPIDASAWLEVADELFFLSSRTNNISEKHLKREMASRAAIASHQETYALKEQAINFWRKNIDPKLSNDNAALLLTKIVPVSFRKLSQYVSEAKKQDKHSASKV